MLKIDWRIYSVLITSKTFNGLESASYVYNINFRHDAVQTYASFGFEDVEGKLKTSLAVARSNCWWGIRRVREYSKMLNEKYFDRIWGRALDILEWENPKSGNLPFLISRGKTYQKCTWELKQFPCPGNATARKITGTIVNRSKWLKSLKLPSLGAGTLQAGKQ